MRNHPFYYRVCPDWAAGIYTDSQIIKENNQLVEPTKNKNKSIDIIGENVVKVDFNKNEKV